jgi:4-amino-4-deoxy-L-arabinose transferase-like glycosyltransferase
MSKDRLKAWLLCAMVAAFGWALAIWATGGIIWETPAFRIFSSRDPFRPLLIGALCGMLYWRLAPEWVPAFLKTADRVSAGRFGILALAVGVAVATAGIKAGARAAGGADTYGYVSQADLWLAGTLRIDQRSLGLPAPFDDRTLSPLGYGPGPERGTIVPLYPPGLPLLMAAAKLVLGSEGPYFVVPLLGGLTICLTFVLGRLLFSELIGFGACLLMAASPTFLYQIMFPMSDVPVTAAWTLAVVSAVAGRPFAAGLASSLAIAIRPNLVTLAIGVGVIVILDGSTNWGAVRRNWRRALMFIAGTVPAALGLAALNAFLYGSPLTFGQASPTVIYQWAYVATNLKRYPLFLLQTQTAFIFLGLLPMASRRLWPSRSPGERIGVRVGLALFVAFLFVPYLFYMPFEAWWYLRFLLPGFPVLLVLAVGSLASLRRVLGPAMHLALATIIVMLVFGQELSTARRRGAFIFREGEQKYVTVGHDLANTTPPNAVFLSMQHSGSLRLYSGRLTVRYDFVPTQSLDEALEVLRARGFRPYFVLETWEEQFFRDLFGASSAIGRLEMEPVKRWDGKVALYDPFAHDSPRR